MGLPRSRHVKNGDEGVDHGFSRVSAGLSSADANRFPAGISLTAGSPTTLPRCCGPSDRDTP
jgi:hypothetical protein